MSQRHQQMLLHPAQPSSHSPSPSDKTVPPGSRLYEQVLDDLRHRSGNISSSSSSCDSSCSSCSSSPSSCSSASNVSSPYCVTFKAELRHRGGKSKIGHGLDPKGHGRDLDAAVSKTRLQGPPERDSCCCESDRATEGSPKSGLSGRRPRDCPSSFPISDRARSQDKDISGGCVNESGKQEPHRLPWLTETKSKATSSPASQFSDRDSARSTSHSPCLQISDFVADLNLQRYSHPGSSDTDHNYSNNNSRNNRHLSESRGQSEKDGMGHVSSVLLHKHSHQKRHGHSVGPADAVDTQHHRTSASHSLPRTALSDRHHFSPQETKEPGDGAQRGRLLPEIRSPDSLVADTRNGSVQATEGLLGGSGGGGEQSATLPGHVVSWTVSSGCQGHSQYFTNSAEPEESSSSRPHPPLSRLYPRAVCTRHNSPTPSRRPDSSVERSGQDLHCQPHRRSGSPPPRNNGASEDRRVGGGGDEKILTLLNPGSSRNQSPSASPILRPRCLEPLQRGLEPATGHDSCSRSHSSPTPSSSGHSQRSRITADGSQPPQHVRLCTYRPDDDVESDLKGKAGSLITDIFRPRSQSDVSVHARRRRQLPRPPLAAMNGTAEEGDGHVHWADERRGSPLATSVLLSSIRPRASSHGAVDMPKKPILKKHNGF